MRSGFWLAAVLLVLAIVAVFWSYKSELDRAREAIARGGLIADTSAGPIEYGQSGDGVPVLSIHGAGGGYDQGIANASGFMGDGFRIIAPSRFGYLRTPAPADASAAAQAEAHAALLSALGVEKAIVIGVSAGANSAIEMALRRPDKVAALILVVPGSYSPTSPVSISAGRGNAFAFWAVNAGGDFAWWAAEKVAPDTLIRFIGVPPALLTDAPSAERARVMAIVRSIEPLSLRFRGINLDSAADLHPLPLERIAAPTLVISARDDLFNTAPAAGHAARGIPNARLVVYDTGGHLLVGRGREVRAVVRDFLDDAGMGARQ